MKKTFVSPQKYTQSPGEILNLGRHIAEMGHKAFLVSTYEDILRSRVSVDQSLLGTGVHMVYATFRDACTKLNFQAMADQAMGHGANVIVGLGGGKSLDAAKGVAFYAKLPVIIVPTIASTDGPCSAKVALYTDTGTFEGYMALRNNPNLVLVDSTIIAQAPARFLVAGMGDALATYFEAMAFHRTHPGECTLLALGIAQRCYDTLQHNSLEALAAVNAQEVTPALENIIEANLLLSCLGFENTGLSLAHAFNNALGNWPLSKAVLHGETVALGVIIQLAATQADELPEVLRYCEMVGLPTKLADIGLSPCDDATLRALAATLSADPQVASTLPGTSAADIYGALAGCR